MFRTLDPYRPDARKPLVFSQLRASVGVQGLPIDAPASDYLRSGPVFQPFFADFDALRR